MLAVQTATEEARAVLGAFILALGSWSQEALWVRKFPTASVTYTQEQISTPKLLSIQTHCPKAKLLSHQNR